MPRKVSLCQYQCPLPYAPLPRSLVVVYLVKIMFSIQKMSLRPSLLRLPASRHGFSMYPCIVASLTSLWLLALNRCCGRVPMFPSALCKVWE